MNDKVEKFRTDLKEHLDAVKVRLDAAKAHLESKANETSEAIESKKLEVEAQLDAQKQKLADAKQQADDWVEAKKSETEEKIAAWKKDRKIDKLERRADDAEDYAYSAIVIAGYAADDAEWAILEAVGARLLAEDAKEG